MIVESFENSAQKPGGVLMFTPQVATQVIHALKTARVRILGIDGFKVTTTTTQPFMEHSIEFPISIEDSWDRAEHFIREKEALGLLFEIVADE